MRTSSTNCARRSVNRSTSVERLIGLARGQVRQINRGRCRGTKSAGGEGAGHGNRIGRVEEGPAVAMMRVPRFHFPAPVEDPVLAETDIDPVAHPDVEFELCVDAFRALRGVGVGKNRGVKTIVRVNATKVRDVN